MSKPKDNKKTGTVMSKQHNFNWEALARSLGTIGETDGGFNESGGLDIARKALATLLDDSFFHSAVHAAIAGVRGGELALAILKLIRPSAAFEETRRLLQGADVETRRKCAWLLKHIGGREQLPDIGRLLADEDEEVRVWAIEAVDGMLFTGNVEPEEIERYLQAAEDDPSALVRQKGNEVRCFLQENESEI